MDKDKKAYLDYFYPLWGPDDCVLCERCGRRAVEIHHTRPKRMGGTTHEYDVDELAAVCRKCHDFAHSSSEALGEIIRYHKIFMEWKKVEKDCL